MKTAFHSSKPPPADSPAAGLAKTEINKPPAQKEKTDWKPTGKRKATSHPAVEARPLRWPTDKKNQYVYRDGWFYIAAQIASSTSHFRMLLAMRQCVRTDTGKTEDTNASLADWGGGASESQASKVISDFTKLGLLTLTLGWRIDAEGKSRRSRTLSLAVPYPFPAHVSIDPGPNQVRARVLDEMKNATSNHPDSSGARAPDSAPRVLDSNKEHDAADSTKSVATETGCKVVEAAGGGQPPTPEEPSVQHPDAMNAYARASKGT